jgi:DNA-binding CsgD family transcriptional regulator
VEELSEIIAACYDCALEPNKWREFFERTGDALGGVAFVMSAIHRDDGLQLMATSRQDPHYQRLLATQYGTPGTNPFVAAMPRLPQATLVPRRDVYPDDGYFRGSLWNEVFRPQDLAHLAIACILRSDCHVVPLGILRITGKGDLTQAEYHLLSKLLPHLQRAMTISLRLAALENQATIDAQVLNRLTIGIIVTDAKCRAGYLNLAAQQIISARDGLSIRNRMLSAGLHGDTTALEAAVARAVARDGDGGEALTIRRKAGHPYVALVAPLGPECLPFLGRQQRRALILISNPDRARVDLPRRLIEIFGLSPAEAQLAAGLHSGKRLEELAEHRRVSANTIKTQVKSIFTKTGAVRQSDLIRVLSSLPETYAT